MKSPPPGNRIGRNKAPQTGWNPRMGGVRGCSWWCLGSRVFFTWHCPTPEGSNLPLVMGAVCFWFQCTWRWLFWPSVSKKKKKKKKGFEVWTCMHFKVKGFKIITLHSNFQTFLQHFTKQKHQLDIDRFVLNMKMLLCLTILKKYMQQTMH